MKKMIGRACLVLPVLVAEKHSDQKTLDYTLRLKNDVEEKNEQLEKEDCQN